MTKLKPLILNVDDGEAGRYAKSRQLRHFGYDVVEAASGTQALALVEELRPAIVLLDIRLPDYSGIEVCEIIKQRWPEVMVLQTSATFTNVRDRIRGLNSGADSYLIQPAEPEELAAAVGALLRIRHAEDELRRVNDELEKRVEQRTRVLAKVNESLKKEITQRQRAEQALIQAQKMEAIGRLTGGLAHDFNNLLTAVIGNLDLIRSRAADPRTLRLAENATKAAERGSKLTAQLLAFSRTQRLALKPTDVNAVIENMSELLNQSLGPEVSVTTRLDPTTGNAMADDNQLELAVLNLAINARDAIDNGSKGAVAIATGRHALTTEDEGLPPGEYVTVEVSDNGSGMAPEVIARAFDPFFTTKPPGKGTGLGLAQVYGVARQCGGDARIDSEPGKGTAVTLWLRAAQEGDIIAEQSILPTKLAVTAGRILLIDDDSDVRGTVRELLEELGYEVHAAESGKAGLTMLPEIGPDLLIVDFAMPDMNGADVARIIHEGWPSLPILFVSGHADTMALEHAVGDAPFLRKPFRPGDLAMAVQQALDGAAKKTGLG
jgi:DNA-binding response OmpR family regulator